MEVLPIQQYWCNKLNRFELAPLVLSTPPKRVSFAAPMESFLPSPEKQ
jgi:hypothetical protein